MPVTVQAAPASTTACPNRRPGNFAAASAPAATATPNGKTAAPRAASAADAKQKPAADAKQKPEGHAASARPVVRFLQQRATPAAAPENP